MSNDLSHQPRESIVEEGGEYLHKPDQQKAPCENFQPDKVNNLYCAEAVFENRSVSGYVEYAQNAVYARNGEAGNSHEYVAAPESLFPEAAKC